MASYKGRANGCEVAGLSPNTLYHFRVRAVNTRTRSSLSPALEVCVQRGVVQSTAGFTHLKDYASRYAPDLDAPLSHLTRNLVKVMTAPRRPEPPVIIRCEQRAIIVKWYPGAPGGAHKYRLQARLVEGLDGTDAAHDNNNNNMVKATEYSRASTAGAAGGVGAGRGGAGGGGRKRRAAWGAAGDGSRSGSEEWVTVYEGVDSTAKVKNRCTACHAVPPVR